MKETQSLADEKVEISEKTLKLVNFYSPQNEFIYHIISYFKIIIRNI